MARRRQSRMMMMTLFRMAVVFASLIHDGASSSSIEVYHSRSIGKRRTIDHEHMATRHSDSLDEKLYHKNLVLIPKHHQLRATSKQPGGGKGQMMPSSVDTSELYLGSEEIPSRTLQIGEHHNKERQERNHHQQTQQHQQTQNDLNQHQYIGIGMPSNSAGAGDGKYRPMGAIVRRGRLFHNINSKGSKRNGKAHKWSKSSKWSKSWDECYWEDTP
jgi:hypothetical protein